MKFRIIFMCIFLSMLIASSVCAQKVYFWKDAKGVMNATTTPPPDNIKQHEVDSFGKESREEIRMFQEEPKKYQRQLDAERRYNREREAIERRSERRSERPRPSERSSERPSERSKEICKNECEIHKNKCEQRCSYKKGYTAEYCMDTCALSLDSCMNRCN